MAKRTLFVGLSGASSSGKTTVSNLLIKILPNSIVIHEDDYYKNDKEIPLDAQSGEQNWDCPQALDLEKLITDLSDIKDNGKSIKSYKKNDIEITDDETLKKLQVKFGDKLAKVRNLIITYEFQVVFLDGFLLYFPDSKFIHFLNVKLFFKVDYGILKFRRESRSGYQTQETFWVDPPGYFDSLVYPNYLKYHNYLFVNNSDKTEQPVMSKESISKFDNAGKIVEAKKNLNIEVFHVKDASTSIEQMASWALDIILNTIEQF